MDQPEQDVKPQGQDYSSNQPQQEMSIEMSEAPPGYVLQYIPPQGQNNSGCDPCCGCMNFSTASSVIGCVGIVLNILVILVLAALYFLIPSESKDTNWALIGLILIQIVYIVFDIILLVGVSKENPKLCMIWIIATGIGLVARLVFGVLIRRFEVFVLAIQIYFIVVVVCYVKELNSKRSQRPAQVFVLPTEVPTIIQPTEAYSNSNAYQEQQNSEPPSQNPTGPGQTYPSPGYPGQSY